MKNKIILSLVFMALPAFLFAGTIDNTDKFAEFLEPSYGNINFRPDHGAGEISALVDDTSLTGYAWGSHVGWINLAPDLGAGSVPVANSCAGNLSGHAWGDNSGWINFAPNWGSGPVPVTINPISGEFNGYAWSDINGWIVFDCGAAGRCVKTDWRPSSSCTGGSGGGAEQIVKIGTCSKTGTTCESRYPIRDDAVIGSASLSDEVFDRYEECIDGKGAAGKYNCAKVWATEKGYTICDGEPDVNFCVNNTTPLPLSPVDEVEEEIEEAIENVQCLAMVMSRQNNSGDLNFDDLSQSHPYYEAISDLYYKGIMTGDDNKNTMRPNDNITRGEFAKLMNVAVEASISVNCVSYFPDTEQGRWFTDQVNYLYETDVVQGYEDGLYRPHRSINYEEAIKIMARVFNYTKHKQVFSENWHIPYDRILKDVGSIIPARISEKGFEEPLSRGEIAEVLSRILVHLGLD